jgi:glucose/arabinose dehydrogenase
MRAILALAAFALALALAAAPGAQATPSSAGTLKVERMAEGLEEPWALAFLPEGGFLVTERAGRLRHVRADGGMVSVAGLPEVAAVGQGGLLDILLPRDFPESREVLLSYAVPQGRGAGTALAAARLSEDGTRLENLRVLFQSAPGFGGGRHFGSRIVEGADGTLFLTIGDRGADASAQDRSNHNGTVVRVARDGSIPADNPFVGVPGVQPEIWSWGHRNAQGAALDAEGRLWLVEHGPRGGDEINLVRPGLNYGWPVATHGRAYSGLRIGQGAEVPGTEPPLHVWTPSIAPSGLTIYDGGLFPGWRGSFLTGSLNADFIARLDPAAGFAEERIATPETLRVRDVRQGPDGAIWFLSVRNGAVYRLLPERSAPGG